MKWLAFEISDYTLWFYVNTFKFYFKMATNSMILLYFMEGNADNCYMFLNRNKTYFENG